MIISGGGSGECGDGIFGGSGVRVLLVDMVVVDNLLSGKNNGEKW